MNLPLKSILRVTVLGVVVTAFSLPALAVLSPAKNADMPVTDVSFADDAAATQVLADLSFMSDAEASFSPLASMMVASTVADHFSGPPFFNFGDVNHDGKVDLFDFVILKANFGNFGPGVTRADGDVTGDMIVGLDDFVVLKKWFGSMSPFLP